MRPSHRPRAKPHPGQSPRTASQAQKSAINTGCLQHPTPEDRSYHAPDTALLLKAMTSSHVLRTPGSRVLPTKNKQPPWGFRLTGWLSQCFAGMEVLLFTIN